MPTDNSRIKVVDLFAGCGGLTEGFHSFRPSGREDAGPVFRTVGAVEWDKAAATTYAVNFAESMGGVEAIHAGDIAEWHPERLDLDVDVILGGPPCQGFSGLNKQNLSRIEDPRNRLWREYARIVKTLNPSVFVIENVDRFLRSPEFTLLRNETERPDGLLSDYRLTTVRVLNAADYGVPQARRRVIVLGTRRDVVQRHPLKAGLDYPEPTHFRPVRPSDRNPAAIVDVDEPRRWVSVQEIFARTPVDAPNTELPESEGCSLLGTEFPGPFRTEQLHIGRRPTELSLRRYARIPPGGNRNALLGDPELTTDSWRRHTSGSGDVMGRLHIDRPSVTIRTEFYKPEKGRYLHPTANRPITHLEAALIQGFPLDFRWCGGKTAIARQIGNAVPVGLARALAGSVFRYLTEVGVVAEPPVAAEVGS
jgi:DNA (cytosine-5)-methyltransferase 1